MDRTQYVHRRKGRYMAQTLEEFERNVQPLIPEEVAESFKATVRRKMNAMAVDVVAILDLTDQGLEINGYSVELQDKLDTR